MVEDHSPSSRFRFSLRATLIGALLVGVLCFLGVNVDRFVTSRYTTRGPDNKSVCRSHLRQLVQAMQLYEQHHGHLPPAYEIRNGYRHSWRVLLLPYLEHQHIYNAYRFDEPWDSANNKRLADGDLTHFFQCRSAHSPPGGCNYFVVQGRDTPFFRDHTITSKQISDHPTNTILLVEAVGTGIHWMEPRDLSFADLGDAFDPNAGIAISSHHDGGANVAFADSRTAFVDKTISPTVLKALFTHAGGETLPADAP
jgi:prepilin-type processing-associated H-X9-DG protein